MNSASGKENDLSSHGKNRLHSVYIPPGFRLIAARKVHLNSGRLFMDLYARSFSQGNVVYAEIYTRPEDKERLRIRRLTFEKSAIPLTEKDWGYRGFFGISPAAKPGFKELKIEFTYDKKQGMTAHRIKISRTRFPVYRRPLDLGKFSDTRRRTPEELKFIKESKVKKRAAFRHRGKDRISGTFSHPRDMHFVTSPFWSKRVYMRYRIKKGRKVRMESRSSVHRGLDLRGEKGTPVYSLADGEVVLADKLYYEGNMVIIDHGNGIFSYFMHMSDLTVKKSDIVKAGSLIGHVGSSGSSTAAHLHVSLFIRGVHLDPLSLLPLPVRD